MTPLLTSHSYDEGRNFKQTHEQYIKQREASGSERRLLSAVKWWILLLKLFSFSLRRWIPHFWKPFPPSTETSQIFRKVSAINHQDYEFLQFESSRLGGKRRRMRRRGKVSVDKEDEDTCFNVRATFLAVYDDRKNTRCWKKVKL